MISAWKLGSFMLKIDQCLWKQLRRHGEETYPGECCGVLLGEVHDGLRIVLDVAPCANARTDSPQNRYAIAPEELFRLLHAARERRLEIVGFYHSHPDHSAHWSKTDLQEAYWFGCSYVITSVEKARAAETRSFTLTGDGEAKRFDDEPLEVADSASPAGCASS
jgi:proteasome lid subunit RPN8/RPN11